MRPMHRRRAEKFRGIPQFETCNSCEAIIAERMDRRSGSGGAPALSRSVARFQDFSWEDAVEIKY